MKTVSLIIVTALWLALAWPMPRVAMQQTDADRGQGTKRPAERRVALVLGNGAYADNPLDNPANDAKGLAAALTELGFEVITDVNKDAASMRRLIRTFGERLRGASVGLFFFAGHGVQVGGVNYLIPLGYQIERESDVRLEAVSADDVLAQMEEAGTGVNLMILDACRDNPFRSLTRSQGQRGLVRMSAPSGTLIVYATKPGSTAADGKGRPNSPFTTSLLQHIKTPGLKIEDFFKQVVLGVEDLTNRKQSPWVEGLLRGDFYFKEPTAKPPDVSLPVYSGEQAFWRAVETSSDVQDFRDYLKQYPNGEYAGTARVKLRRLEAAAANAAIVSNPNTTTAPPVRPAPTPAVAYAKVGGSAVPLVTMGFTTASVDARGTVSKKPGQSANGFVEELGNGVRLEMIEVAGGSFDMGSPSAEAEHQSDEVLRRGVRINALYVGRFEVTQAQWKAVMNSLPNVGFSGDELPVERVSWDEAIAFCQRLSAKTGREYRLPTEAEWEYAARAGSQTPFAFGATITPEVVNYDSNFPYGNAPKDEKGYRAKTVPVGSLGVANAWGLFDMHGNVWEWCQDWYGDYDARQLDNPTGASSGQYRALRGGSWNLNGRSCRAANRDRNVPGARNFNFGVRVVMSARTRP